MLLGAVGSASTVHFGVPWPVTPATHPAGNAPCLSWLNICVSWEHLRLPHEVDGSSGTFRAPRQTCTLGASNDYEAVQAWLALHESAATQRAYRKEAERQILWAIVERERPLSSLTTEDAIAFRTFLRRPTPHKRWVGPPRPRTSSEWRPFAQGLSPRSTAYALSVLGAMFRWLIQQRYVLANPFAGIKVRGSARAAPLDTSHVFTEGEWMLVRTLANGLEWSYGGRRRRPSACGGIDNSPGQSAPRVHLDDVDLPARR